MKGRFSVKMFLCLLTVISLISALPTLASAGDTDWSGTQVQLGYTARGHMTSLGNGWSLDAISSVTYFNVPQNTDDPSLWFVYAGTELSRGPIWFDLLAGYTDFFGDRDASILALWAGYSVGKFDADTDHEWIADWKGESAYYGLYSLGYNPSDKIRLDVHAEQVRDLLQYGPGIRVKLNGASITGRYFNGQGSHAFRVAISN